VGEGARRRLRRKPVERRGHRARRFAAAFPIPKAAFEGLLAGCRQDLAKTRYATFDELLGYCDLVASTISTISLAIFGGLGNAEAEARGRDLATALQLTNVVRDVGEDVGRGRLYLPLEDLARFGVSEEDVASLRATPAVAELVRFEARRALSFFRRAEPVKELVDRECRFAVTMMGGIYADVAREVLARPLERCGAASRSRRRARSSRCSRASSIEGSTAAKIDARRSTALESSRWLSTRRPARRSASWGRR
jgi:Phytoene/squalene synthetase